LREAYQYAELCYTFDSKAGQKVYDDARCDDALSTQRQSGCWMVIRSGFNPSS
jgi:hypothetical protein